MKLSHILLLGGALYLLTRNSGSSTQQITNQGERSDALSSFRSALSSPNLETYTSAGEDFIRFIPSPNANPDPIAPHEKVVSLDDWIRTDIAESWHHTGMDTTYAPYVTWYNRVTGENIRNRGEQYLTSPWG